MVNFMYILICQLRFAMQLCNLPCFELYLQFYFVLFYMLRSFTIYCIAILSSVICFGVFYRVKNGGWHLLHSSITQKQSVTVSIIAHTNSLLTPRNTGKKWELLPAKKWFVDRNEVQKHYRREIMWKYKFKWQRWTLLRSYNERLKCHLFIIGV
jgi:hypothetical protein